MRSCALRYSLLFSMFVSLALLVGGCGSSQHASNGSGKTPYTKSLSPAQEKELVKEAKKWLGTKYRYGGHSRSGTDCSGMVMEVYKKVCDVKLPRSSREQQAFCKSIKRDNLRKGDLVFFASGKSRDAVSHVGLYIGDGEIIHASSSKGVMISNLNENYFKRTYHSSGRVLAAAGSKAIESAVPAAEVVDLPPEVKQQAIDPALPSKILEDVIDQKIDSIYSTMFD